MIPVRLSEIAEITGGKLIGADKTIVSLSTDSRAISHGDLFVALQGEYFDGNEYALESLEHGASAVMVSREQVDFPASQVLVGDTTRALGAIATWIREQWGKPLVAITGSCGKTTVKGMVASILGELDSTMATEGNLNNHIGVPKTLMRLDSNFQYAVVEMGASAVGEINYLTHLAKPQVALVNNVVPAHLEGFGSVDAIATAKGEIYSGLSSDGTAIINLDDQYAGQWLKTIGDKNWLGFSVKDHNADLYSTHIEIDARGCANFDLCTKVGKINVQLNVLGRANVANALAAAACTVQLDATLEQIKAGLEKFRGVGGRLQVCEGIDGSWVIDDSYNANPGSVKAAIDVLAEFPSKKILVLGDMGELGIEAQASHREVGRYALSEGIDLLLTVGPLSKRASTEFGEPSKNFVNNAELTEVLKTELGKDVVVLVKGSRSAGMESVVQAILKDGVTV